MFEINVEAFEINIRAFKINVEVFEATVGECLLRVLFSYKDLSSVFFYSW